MEPFAGHYGRDRNNTRKEKQERSGKRDDYVILISGLLCFPLRSSTADAKLVTLNSSLFDNTELG